MARWEQYEFYPKNGVKWLKPAHNPTGLLIKHIDQWMKDHNVCLICRPGKNI